MPTPDEIAALRQALLDAIERGEQAARRSEELAGELRVVRTERDLLQEQLNRFKRQLFEAKSEASAAHQKDLFFNEAEVEGAQAQPAAAETEDEKIEVPAHQRAKRGRKPLDPALPREVRRHELPEGERVCPHDGARLSEIGVEVSEQLDIVPQQVRVIRHERVKYACPCCDGGLRLAAKPPQVIPKGLLSEAALAWVITSKYLDGLPLYRQAALLGRFGGDLSRNTLAASVVRVGQAVRLQVDAYAYTWWGALDGKVAAIGGDSLAFDRAAPPGFKVLVHPAATTLTLPNGTRAELRKGLTVSARFLVARRSVLQLLYDEAGTWLNPQDRRPA